MKALIEDAVQKSNKNKSTHIKSWVFEEKGNPEYPSKNLSERAE